MKKINWSWFNWKKIKSTVLWYFSLDTRREENENATFCTVTIPLTKSGKQKLNSLIERSGVKDISDLLTRSIGLFDLMVETELQGGSIDLVERNGVNKEKLELLRHINGDDDWWKDWGETPEE